MTQEVLAHVEVSLRMIVTDPDGTKRIIDVPADALKSSAEPITCPQGQASE